MLASDDKFDYSKEIAAIESRDDFVIFMQRFRMAEPLSDWENQNTDTYLEVLIAVVEGLDGRYGNRGEALPEKPTWKMFAEILGSATIYE